MIQAGPLASTVADLRNGGLKLHEYIDRVCDRIDAVDGQLAALLPEADRRARLYAEADALIVGYPNPLDRPRLYGALVGVKDIFHVPGFVTRAGSQVPPEQFAPPPSQPEAVCVRQLRSAGALVLGKTVTTEFAYFEPGPTRNPHNLAHTPGGSSSGSAAAVAAGFCTLALGTQTIGSVIRPAAYCGIIGFKPSYDRIATAGIVYFSRTADHVGLFTQDMAGMILAARVLVENWTPPASHEGGSNHRPTLGVPDGPYLAQTEPAALAAFERQVRQLQDGGYTVKRLPMFADIADLNQLHRRMVAAEFAQEHAAIYPVYAGHYRPRTREIIEVGQSIGADELAAARANCLRLRAEVEAQMDEAGIDLWVCPAATGPAPAGIHATGDPLMNLPWTHIGLPAITLPAGWSDDGLPLGLQFVGRFGADERLLAWMQALAAANILPV
jgi:Asp-tRNA(Asn)/Glu-tRNA(Gln) amidotransferase A subunit family amidase